MAYEMCPKIWITNMTVNPKFTADEIGRPGICIQSVHPIHPKNINNPVPRTSAASIQILSMSSDFRSFPLKLFVAIDVLSSVQLPELSRIFKLVDIVLLYYRTTTHDELQNNTE